MPASTRLSLADLRADALHRLLLSSRGRVATVEQIPGLSDLFSWPREQVQTAIADLVACGRISERADGGLVVHHRSTRAA